MTIHLLMELLVLFLLLFFIPKSLTQNPPVVPLTNSLTAIYCHNDDYDGIMTIRCGLNEKIRMLDAYDIVVKNKTYLPIQCLTNKHISIINDYNYSLSNIDCKIPTSFSSACSGRENCTVNMQRKYLNTFNDNCHNQLVDYTVAFFECISDVFIHDICSTQAITSAWGTLKTPNFPNPYTSNDDCWCKLSTQLQYKLLLSVIVFQLIPYDPQCAGAGLYLQSSTKQQTIQCTYLQQGHNYLSDTNNLYLNFYSRMSTVRGGFWIIYEANHPNAEVHLQCGPREKIGVPSLSTPLSSPLISFSSYNDAWRRLLYDTPTSTTLQDHMMHMGVYPTTPHSFLDRKSKISSSTGVAAAAFTYPYGRLTTFELDFGPRGWFLKYLFGTSNATATKFLQTTSPTSVVKWNSTWRYIRRFRPRIFTNMTTIKTTATTTTSSTTTQTTTLTSARHITTPAMVSISPTTISTTTYETVSVESPLLSTQNPSVYESTNNRNFPITSTMDLSTLLITTAKSTLPVPTPWYPPAGLDDWWHRQKYTGKTKKVPGEAHTSTETSTTTTVATTMTITTTTTHSTTVMNSTKSTITTIRTTNGTTVDWLEWPYLEFINSTIKGRFGDYDDEEYNKWLEAFSRTKIQSSTTTNSFLSMLPEKQRQKFQQMNFFPTQLNDQLNQPLITSRILTSRKYSTPRIHNENNFPENEFNDLTTTTQNTQNIVQQTNELNNRKNTEENPLLSRTDLTIVGVSILFVTLLLLVNLILYAVRRYRHRSQSRHLLSSSSSINPRRMLTENDLHNKRNLAPINGFGNTTNNNNDILPAVGEILIWDEKDQGGYMIDNHGEWAKIDRQQWIGNKISKNFNKTSPSKSFRSRFQFIHQSNKKFNNRHSEVPKTPQQVFKYPLLMDTASLSPVPEVDDYRLSQLSSETTLINTNKTIQALVHKEQDHSDEYYKRIETGESESNYTTMQGNEVNNEGSVRISVPIMLRQEDEITDGGDSIYNQNYSIQSSNEINPNRILRFNNQPKRNNTLIIGYCQADIQPLDPKLLIKSKDKSFLADHQQLNTCSQSLPLSTYDSGFFDDQTIDSSARSTIRYDDDNNDMNKQSNIDEPIYYTQSEVDNEEQHFSTINRRDSQKKY